jgi:hypothetical protein
MMAVSGRSSLWALHSCGCGRGWGYNDLAEQDSHTLVDVVVKSTWRIFLIEEDLALQCSRQFIATLRSIKGKGGDCNWRTATPAPRQPFISVRHGGCRVQGILGCAQE